MMIKRVHASCVQYIDLVCIKVTTTKACWEMKYRERIYGRSMRKLTVFVHEEATKDVSPMSSEKQGYRLSVVNKEDPRGDGSNRTRVGCTLILKL